MKGKKEGVYNAKAECTLQKEEVNFVNRMDSLGHMSGLRAVLMMVMHLLDKASPGDTVLVGEPGKDVLSVTWHDNLYT